MTSAIAIINARRVWRGGPASAATDTNDTLSYPAGCDAVLIDGGTIAFVGSTNAVLERYTQLHQRIALAQAQHADDSAVAVNGGRPRRRTARIIDCEHKYTVLPGFIDAHVHLLDGGRRLHSPQLDMANSRASFVATLRAYMKTTTMRRHDSPHESAWVYGGGWSEAVLGGLPTRDWLDEVCIDTPVVLYSKDVHSCVTNTVVLRLCHLLPAATAADSSSSSSSSSSFVLPVVEGGRIECDADGLPTGVLRDNAMKLLRRYMPTTDTEAGQRAALSAASAYFLSRGFTMVHSMTSTLYANNIHEVRFLQAMERRGELRLRVRYAVPAYETTRLVTEVYTPLLTARNNNNNNSSHADEDNDAFLLPYRFTALPPRHGGGYCLLGAVKIFSDGSLSSRTAAMTRPYGYDVLTEGDIDSDVDDDGAAALAAAVARVRGAAVGAVATSSQSSSSSSSCECQCGMLLMPPQELQAAITLAHAHYLQCCVHAIGDRAVATTNKALAASGAQLLARHEHDGGGGGGSSGSMCDGASWLHERLVVFCANPRSRVEHCQHMGNVTKELQRMRAHHIIASMQPNQLLFDGDYIDELLGSRRKSRAYLWHTLLKHHVRVALGSDWPVAPADVDDGLRGAVTRVPDVMSSLAAAAAAAAAATSTATMTRAADGDDDDAATHETTAAATPPQQQQQECGESDALHTAQRRYHAVWNADECLSMTEALCTYTYESAYAAFMEDYVGTLDVGKYADVTIWSDDHLDTTAHVTLGDNNGNTNVARWWRPGSEPRVLYTIVGGNIEYEADAISL